MRIHSTAFVVGAVNADAAPSDGLPEVAFSGRSNVGKSSLINRLTERRGLARTSSTPGKTQQLNYYRINDSLYLVDLPGYGYVRGGAELRRDLGKLTQTYLQGRSQLRGVIQLVDARHGPTSLDLAMIDSLQKWEKPFVLVFTKIDKLSRGKLNRQLEALTASGHLTDLQYVTFSAVSGEGREDVWEWMERDLGIGQEAASSGGKPQLRQET